MGGPLRKITFPIRILYAVPDLMLNAYFRHVLDFCRYLNRDRFLPSVTANNLDRPGEGMIRETGAQILQLQLYPRPGQMRLGSLITAPAAIKRHGFLIQHSFHWSSLWLEGIISRLAGVPLWITTKTGMEWTNHRFNWYLRSALSDRIIALNDTMATAFFARRFRKKTVVIPLGIDIDRFAPAGQDRKYRDLFRIPENTFVIGYVAQFVPRKDHATLLRAFAWLVKEGWPVYLLLAGGFMGSTYQKSLAELAEKLNVMNRLSFVGFVEDTDAFLRNIDCLAFTSREEAFGMAVIEAMACGLPVVSTRTEGPAEIVMHGETGMLVPIGNDEAIKSALVTYIKSPELRRMHGMNARKRVEMYYSTAMMIRRHEEFYLEALREKGFGLS